MEWIEVAARTVEEAKDVLLDRLGVDESEAEFEILEEPRAGLFGRVRGEARVRARVVPKSPRPKDDRRRRSRSSGSGNGSGGGQRSGGSRSSTPDESGRPRERGPANRPEKEAEVTVDPETVVAPVTTFLEGLVESFGVTATVAVDVTDEGRLAARVDGDQLGALIGPHGAVIDAVQELARTVAQKESDGPAPRLRVDIGGYREGRAVALEAYVRELGERVKSTGVEIALDPMGSVERKLVHDVAGEIEGVGTRSEGEDPDRRVVLVPNG